MISRTQGSRKQSSEEKATETTVLRLCGLLVVVLLVSLAVGFAGTAAAQTTTAPDCTNVGYTTDGSGNYEVTNVSQLQCVGNASTSTSLTDSFVLTQDIDASGTSSWNGGDGFAPVGNASSPFTGTFDGNGYAVSDLTIDRADESDVGLFGVNDGTVTRTTVSGSVTGDISVGALVGTNTGTVTQSNATATVDGVDTAGALVGTNDATVEESFADGTVTGSLYLGGLVGWNKGTGSVTDSYAETDLASPGASIVGGVVGKNEGTVDGTYATGSVDGDARVGGVVGDNEADVTTSYWDLNTTGQTDGIGKDGTTNDATGLTTDEMTGLAADANTALDYSSYVLTEGYPGLRWAVDDAPGVAPQCGEVTYDTDGDGNREVETLAQLQCMSENLSADYVLTTDIEAGWTASWNDGKGFAPVGTDDTTPFNGIFDGQYNTVSGLTIDRSDDYVGLFGYTDASDVEITNVTLESVDVTGREDVGGVVGLGNRGEFRNVHVGGTVDGDTDVGGFMGSATVASSFNSSASVDVSGSNTAAGGFVGGIFAGSVENSYATGNVTGNDEVGGFAGDTLGDISSSYATGAVSGNTDVGGFVGNNGGTIEDSYWDVNTTEQQDGIGDPGTDPAETNNVTGLTTDEMKGDAARTNMTALDFTATWDVVDNATYISYPYLRNNPQTPAPGLESVTPDDPYFAVTITDVNASVVAGEDVVVDATVENLGDQSGTQTVEFTVNGTTEESRSVSLTAGGSTAETFTYTTSASDTPEIDVGVASENETATRSVTVNDASTNDPPTASDDSYAITENDTLSVSAPGVLDNDTDDDGDTLTATLVGAPTDGTVSLSADGSFDYTPDAGFVGEDSFTYEASDGNGGTDQATVTVNVTEATPQTAYFRVDITDVNASVVAGDDVVVDATVENTGSESGTQTVEFTVDGTTETTRSVSLNAADSTTETFTYTTGTNDTPEIDVGVASENETVTERVEVRDEGGGDDCVNRRNLGRGEEDEECPSDRDTERGGSRDGSSTGRNTDTGRRDRGRGESGSGR